MLSSVTAYCPGHLSGYFLPVFGKNPETTGSLGSGIVIRQGVTARVSRSTISEVIGLRFGTDGRILDRFTVSPPLDTLAKRLSVSVRIETCCSLPIQAGFGLSAAALIASALAINTLSDLGLTDRACIDLAHEIEISHRTGLGDVAACQGGGRDYRSGPGLDAPITRYYDIDEPLFAVNFGPLPTPRVLNSPDALARISSAYPGEKPDTARKFFRLARSFADATGLVSPKIAMAFAACDREDVPATMTMLGNGVFALGLKGGEILSSFGQVYELGMAASGARITGVAP